MIIAIYFLSLHHIKLCNNILSPNHMKKGDWEQSIHNASFAELHCYNGGNQVALRHKKYDKSMAKSNPSDGNHFVSVVIPVYNEKNFIEKCIRSVLSQDFPSDKMEILVMDGMSNDGTPDIIRRLCNEDNRIKLLENPKKYVPSAMNIGIKAAKGDIIVRMDSHCEYPTNYVSALVEKLIELDADNVGGMCIMKPANDSVSSLAVVLCFSHRFGTGSALYKVGCDKITEVDTVPFGCFKKDIFDKVGFYDEDMHRNEDEELNARITNHGGKIFIIPEIGIRYTPRDTIGKLSKMLYHYGLWKPLVNKKVGNAVSYRQFAPPMFFAFFVFGLILGILFPPILTTWAFVMIFYFAIAFAIGVKYAIKHKRASLCIMMPITFFCMHISYGYGYIKGLLFNNSLSYKIDR